LGAGEVSITQPTERETGTGGSGKGRMNLDRDVSTSLTPTDLNKSYGDARLENACRIGLVEGLHTVKSIRNILQHKLDQVPASTEDVNTPLNQHHENVRGSKQYH